MTTIPTAPLPPAAVEALTPEVQKAVARYEVASAAIAKVSQVMGTRDLTDVEASDFEFVQDVMLGARQTLADAGRLDLIEVAA
jgi:hypothetical protein